MRRLFHILAVLLLGISLGLHWAALQGVAWTSMLVERAQTTSFSEAIRTTFDGKHPCRICKLVHDGKSSQRSTELPSSAHAFDLDLGSAGAVEVPHVKQPSAVAAPTVPGQLRSHPPIAPPPRRV